MRHCKTDTRGRILRLAPVEEVSSGGGLEHLVVLVFGAEGGGDYCPHGVRGPNGVGVGGQMMDCTESVWWVVVNAYFVVCGGLMVRGGSRAR